MEEVRCWDPECIPKGLCPFQSLTQPKLQVKVVLCAGLCALAQSPPGLGHPLSGPGPSLTCLLV